MLNAGFGFRLGGRNDTNRNSFTIEEEEKQESI
jgi:hypothetical protein